MRKNYNRYLKRVGKAREKYYKIKEENEKVIAPAREEMRAELEKAWKEWQEGKNVEAK